MIDWVTAHPWETAVLGTLILLWLVAAFMVWWNT